ncbi:MAG TPA: GFA family protein [Stellaceae bacterium]|nr:GFA family protein [Stellaceae bacterium]
MADAIGLTGGCQCGAVRYAITGPPERVHLCHCRMCQKAVGGPFAASAPVRRRDFAWTRGTPASFASSSVAHRDFCARCGTPLTFRYDDAETISVTLGSLDAPERVPPVRQYGIEGRVSWLDRIASLPFETTAEAMAPDRQRRFANHQHPDHDTPEGWTPHR